MPTTKRLGLRLTPPAKVDFSKTAIKTFLAASMLFPARAMAQDWSAPATSMLESLESGLVSVAAPVIGVGVIIYGIWAMVTGRIDIMRLAQLVGAGALVIFGPTALRALLSTA
ncbi:TrbC/VirB2 family protein [Roseibium album]|uniref:TrbC/VIRB2 family protein n=1 Tax=Roseibium album TaxID=311410 RepID=A0A0M7AY03_9HYPH|nr:TrbC/VirB2 family protein [Roseibium album]CTQ63357.1 TrbC/VIRB2 family protein [Roseibium album]CTQ79392.1 TrbC/VIRB2 family protein [Roseibium album]CTQ80944.1 TrbC/VIRB2 family protein [Roseibium album]